MSAKTTWSLVFIAAILFAFIFFVEHPYREVRSRPPELHVLPGFNPTNITSIQLQPAGQIDIRIDHTNSAWQITRPVAYPADRLKINQFLQKLSELTWQGRISATDLQSHENAPEEFGFDTPQFSITFFEGKNRRHLQIGKKMPVGDQVFVQVVGADGIYVIDSDILKLLPQEEEIWRDHHIAQWGTFAFNTIKAKTGNNSFEFQFNSTNYLWRMTRPLETRADNTKINGLLQKLVLVQITEFVSDDTNADLDKFGLLTPELEISLGAWSNEVFTLQIGTSPTNNPSLVFAKHKNQPNVFLVSKEPFSSWQLPYTDFREHHLATLPEKAIDEINVKGDDAFTLQKRTTNSWTISEDNSPADAGLVQELLARLNLCEIEVEKNVVTDFSTYGLEKPLLQYTLSVSTNITNQFRADRVTKIDFGTNNGKIFAHRSDESSVYSIKLDDFQFLPRAKWQMQDRRIWNFESTDVVNILIQQKGQSRQLIRNAKGDWIIAPGYQGIVNNTFALEEGLHRLGELKAVFWTAKGAANLEKYGFKEADYQISLQVKRGGKLETLDLEFGGMSEFQHPYAAVTLHGEKLIFEFPWPLYYDFIVHDFSLSPQPPLRTK